MVNQPFLNQTKTTPLPGHRAGESFLCYEITILTGNHTGIWQEVNPVTHALPVFVMQLIIITSLTRLLQLALKPFNQPRFVAEIIAGSLLGPSVMGRVKQHSQFLDAVFPASGVMMLEAMGNMGLIYFLFLLGLEMDLTTTSRVGRKAFALAVAGTLFPFAVGLSLYYLLRKEFGKDFQLGSIVWGVALTVTGLPVIAQILAKLKLLYTDVGKTAMSAALVNEIFSWVLLTIAMALGSNVGKAPWALLSTAGFVLFCVYAVRPAIIWTICRTQKGGNYSEETICVILTSVLACGLATDLLGTNSMVGAFVFGLVIPNGLLGGRFVEVLRGFVEDLLLPIFYALIGFRTNFDEVASSSSWFLVGVVIAVGCLCKIMSTLVVSFFHGMQLREAMALGLLMNTKGILALIVLNSARDHMLIEDKAFTVMWISILLMTMATQPVISILCKPTKRFLPNKHRAIQRLKPDAELRILACVHEAHSVAGIIKLLQVSNPSRRSPIAVFALHLIQLTGHTTALLIVHSQHRSSSNGQPKDQILDAFERFEEENGGVSVHPLTAMSPYPTMHEDICSIAEDKRVTLIIIPFHKRQTIHNKMEDMNHDYKDVNDNLLVNAPCSVGILVDRGFGNFTEAADGESVTRHIAMLYVGGADDREALCYAKKMAGHPNTTLTVVRFVESKHEVDLKLMDIIEDPDEVSPTAAVDAQAETRLDEGVINDFRQRTAGDRSIMYLEKAVSNGADTIETIRSMGQGYDLYVIGRRIGMSSPLTAGIDEWSEGPELGAIGDLLVTSDFSSTVSVLVVQQYTGVRPTGDGAGILNPRPSESSFEPFVKHGDMDEGF